MAIKNVDFELACDFFRTKINKAFVLTYDQKLTLSALYNQAKHGPFNPDKVPDIGMFDFIGKERRNKWQSLATMSEVEAQDTFVQTLIQICPQFAAHLEASLCMPDPDLCHENTFEGDQFHGSPPLAPHGINEGEQISTSQPSKLNLKQIFSSQQENQIRIALNSQTIDQFREYALKHHPNDLIKQNDLISQLQDRHFHQYMKYLEQTSVPQDHFMESPSIFPPSSCISTGQSEQDHPTAETDIKTDVSEIVVGPNSTTPIGPTSLASPYAAAIQTGDHSNQEIVVNEVGEMDKATSSECGTPAIDKQMPAVDMWTRKEIGEFKTLLVQDSESVVNVGCGELVTIRVPSVSDGHFLVWEFATDDYDIGFGLFFEWLKPFTPTVVGEAPWKNFIEGSSEPPADVKEYKDAECDLNQRHLVEEELIPITRCTSNTEVFCGSHAYPGNGTYLLKFDNTYSLWRSKVLYYRVYCTA